MQRTIKTLGSLLITIAVVVMTASAAEAEIKPPIFQGIQPAFHCQGPVCGEKEIIVTSLNARLWAPKLGIVIECPNSTYAGAFIEKKGEPKGSDFIKEIKYTGCEVFATGKEEVSEETEHKGRLEDKEKTKCTVKGGGGVAGEIILKNIKSKLAYRPGSEVELLDVLEPTVQPFVTLEIEGEPCVAKGKFEVKGGVIGKVARDNEEAITGALLFESKNWEPNARQRFIRYELRNKEFETKLSLGENPAYYEATTQIELGPVGQPKKQFGAYFE